MASTHSQVLIPIFQAASKCFIDSSSSSTQEDHPLRTRHRESKERRREYGGYYELPLLETISTFLALRSSKMHSLGHAAKDDLYRESAVSIQPQCGQLTLARTYLGDLEPRCAEAYIANFAGESGSHFEQGDGERKRGLLPPPLRSRLRSDGAAARPASHQGEVAIKGVNLEVLGVAADFQDADIPEAFAPSHRRRLRRHQSPRAGAGLCTISLT